MDEFTRRTRYLERQIGKGKIVAGCTVDQPYAQDQHETPYNHSSGRPRYLGGPLLENAFSAVNEIARRVITPAGSDLKDAMSDFAEEMAREYVGKEAPVDTGRLRESGEPWVVDEGMEIYRRPAVAPREEESEPGWDRRRP
jgi:hypothetical protein